jgi:hypothetical protein
MTAISSLDSIATGRAPKAIVLSMRREIKPSYAFGSLDIYLA